jgi:hypothetical protein
MFSLVKLAIRETALVLCGLLHWSAAEAFMKMTIVRALSGEVEPKRTSKPWATSGRSYNRGGLTSARKR